MKNIVLAVISVALLAACGQAPQSMIDTSYILDNQHIEGVVEDVDDVYPKDYYFYPFEADSLLQKEVENNLGDTTVVLDYATLPFQVDSNDRILVINAIDEMIFNLGKDSVEILILRHNRDFLDSLENRLTDVDFRIYTLQTVTKWNNEEF